MSLLPDEQTDTLVSIRRHLALLLVLVTAVVFYFGKDIIMPMVLGLLINFTLTPPTRGLRKLGVPPGLAALLIVVSVGGVIGSGVWFLSTPISELVERVPTLSQKLTERVAELRSSVDTITSVSDQVENLAGESETGVQKVVIKQPGLVSSATSTLASGLSSLAVSLIFALFLLGTGNLFYEKIIAAMPVLSEKNRALRILYDVEDSVSRYLFTITLVNIGLGLVISLALTLYGAPNAALWGAMATSLNFLPFVGGLIGTGLLALMSLGYYDTVGHALIPPLIYFACTAIEGNFLTPLIVGRRLELNIVAVFLAVALWGWLWGIAGALMAVPMLVAFKVLCDHVDAMSTWGQFLSGRRTPEFE